MAKDINKRKTEQWNRNKRESPATYPAPTCAACCRSRPSPSPLPPCRLPRASTQRAWPTHAGARLSHLLLAAPPRRLDASGRRHAPPLEPPRPLPSPLPFSVPLAHNRPSATVADPRCPRGHRHPLSSPTRSRAPQCLPRPLRRLTRPEKPRSAIPTLFPSSATEDRRCRFAASDASPTPPSCSSTSR